MVPRTSFWQPHSKRAPSRTSSPILVRLFRRGWFERDTNIILGVPQSLCGNGPPQNGGSTFGCSSKPTMVFRIYHCQVNGVGLMEVPRNFAVFGAGTDMVWVLDKHGTSQHVFCFFGGGGGRYSGGQHKDSCLAEQHRRDPRVEGPRMFADVDCHDQQTRALG